MLYWGILALAVGVSAALAPFAIWLSRRTNIAAAPGGRRQHRGIIPKLGGLAVFGGLAAGWGVAWWLAPLGNPADRLRIMGVVAGTLVVFIGGLLDDHYGFKPGPQFGIQAVAVLIAILTTVFIERFTNPLNGKLVVMDMWAVVPITAFWIMGMMNTVNWLDGLDGLATGVAAIAALLFALHMRSLGQPEIALYALALAGACLGFLPFNFSPAKVFLGSAGAMVLGYTLATFSILAPARYATALLVMAVPITDTAWQIIDRYRRGAPLTKGDRGHLHYRLLDMGFSQRRIVLAYWLFGAVFGALSLFTSPLVKLLTLALLVLALFGVLAFLARHSRNGASASGGSAQETPRQAQD